MNQFGQTPFTQTPFTQTPYTQTQFTSPYSSFVPGIQHPAPQTWTQQTGWTSRRRGPSRQGWTQPRAGPRRRGRQRNLAFGLGTELADASVDLEPDVVITVA